MSLFNVTKFRSNAVVCALSLLLVTAPIAGYSQEHKQHQAAATSNSQQQDAHYYCPMHPEETSHEPGRCAKCNMFLVKDEQLDTSSPDGQAKRVADKDYYCPMHPEVTSHEPDRCPKCNMFLVKEEEEENQIDEHAGHNHSATELTNQSEPQSKAEQLLSQPKPTLIPAAQSSGDGNVKYVCPMHPHVVSDVPGTCPICGMNLEKVNVGAATEEVVVGVTGGMQQALGMRSEQVTKGTLWKLVKTIGTVEYNENAIGHAHTRVSGWLETLMVHTVGQRVKKGQLLYELSSPELINAQDDYRRSIISNKTKIAALDCYVKHGYV